MLTQSEFIDKKEIFTVQQLNQTARALLENRFRFIWVQGELSNVAMPRSGHIYFTLKDPKAQIRCAMFKNALKQLPFKPEEGMQVLLRANVSLYEERGDYQLIVTHMEQGGLGQLQQAFEALKAKLLAEGMFDQKNKKNIPPYPQHIGVITSHTGAAIQDILSVLKRRYPIATVLLYHTQVQGKSAANEIANTIQMVNQQHKAEVIILGRGGGSLEDLWCFNEEVVARSIYDSQIPIVTGIGHEVDFTIADFVADYRAPTPSAAAEYITPDMLELLNTLENYSHRLHKIIEWTLHRLAQKCDQLEKRLIHPEQRLAQYRLRLKALFKEMKLLINQKIRFEKNAFNKAVDSLNTISPLSTLNRGYAIVTADDKNIVRDAHQLKLGQILKTTLSKGSFLCQVKEIEKR